MAVKYRCSKCDRKFVDWGAEKVKSKGACDECQGEHLELIGFDAAASAPKKKPTLKRKRAKKAPEPAPTPIASYDDEVPGGAAAGNSSKVDNPGDASLTGDDVPAAEIDIQQGGND